MLDLDQVPCGTDDPETTDTYLEHLYKRYAQVEVGQVAADETSAVDQTYGNNGTHVLPASHLDGLAAIEQPRGSSEGLCSDSSEDHVP